MGTLRSASQASIYYSRFHTIVLLSQRRNKATEEVNNLLKASDGSEWLICSEPDSLLEKLPAKRLTPDQGEGSEMSPSVQ